MQLIRRCQRDSGESYRGATLFRLDKPLSEGYRSFDFLSARAFLCLS